MDAMFDRAWAYAEPLAPDIQDIAEPVMCESECHWIWTLPASGASTAGAGVPVLGSAMLALFPVLAQCWHTVLALK
jgi:hypothetical protein